MQDEKFAEWARQARIKAEPKLRPDLPPDIFAGDTVFETCKLKSGTVRRLNVLPAGFDGFPESFAVLPEHEFCKTSKFELPFDLQWQQSLPRRYDISFPLPDDSSCFGLGERYSALNLRGARHTLLSTDNSHHDESADALYKSIPFLIVHNNDSTSGIFIDSPAPQRWDLDSELDGIARIEILTQRPWSMYFFEGNGVAQITKMFSELTGRTPLPPRWALGHFQCRWSYGSDRIVREIASEMRQRKIPCDCIVFDIDYMEGYRVFTHSKEYFPQFKKLIADLAQDNFKVMTIVDPGVKHDDDYTVFQEGEKNELFCLKHNGDIFFDQVWPGKSAFPDFLKPETRKWWGQLHKFYTDSGVAAIWNDMNEPAFFTIKHLLPAQIEQLPSPEEEMFFHDLNGEKVSHLELRNLYGLLMSRATHEGLLELQPQQRPFVLTRSAYAGIQKYAAVWLGDNKSWWAHLQKTIPMLLNMGLCGVAFGGVDIGGFGDDSSPELLLRWYEQGIFYPFFRNHSMMDSRAQEPWAFNAETESKIRRLVEIRYSLLPYLQCLFWQHLRSGAPIMQPLLWHYPQDKRAAEISDQFFFGESIMVAPVIERAARSRKVYFPEGRWHPFAGGEVIEGPALRFVDLPLGMVPAWVKEGSIIPRASAMQSTAEYAQVQICFHVYGDVAQGYYIEDDGESFAYRDGEYGEWFLRFENGELKSKRKHNSRFEPTRRFSFAAAGTKQEFSLS